MQGPFPTDLRANRFTDVEHGGIVTLAFANGHAAVEGGVVKRATHGFHGGAVGCIFVAKTTPFSAGQRRHVDGFEQVGPDVADAHGPRTKEG